MKLKFFFLLLLLLYIVNSTLYITHATVRFVSKSGTSTPPFLSWNDAADSIQKCINISQFGDTIYVANGVYKEQVVMIPGLALIGAGMDSCVIDTKDLVTTSSFRAVEVADSCHFEKFQIIVYHNSDMGRGIYCLGSGLVTQNQVTNGISGIYAGSTTIIYKNKTEGNRIGIYVINSNALVRKNYIYHLSYQGGSGIHIEGFDYTYKPTIDSNYIETINRGISKAFGTSPTITNNIIVIKNGFQGIFLSISDSAKVYNNLIISENGAEGFYNGGTQYLELSNNYITGNFRDNGNYWAIRIGPGNQVKQNVITNAIRGVSVAGTENLVYQYNNVWNNEINYSGFTPDTTNLSVDPMIVNDDPTQGELDFHLQKYSPLIDAGDPNILDRDGSRSDIGLYGGPYGWTYTYNDLAPRPPHNVTAVNEDGLIKLTWNKNTETDFSHYRIYRDTVSILIYDSTRIIGITSDTVFYDNLPPSNTEKNYYYLITAFDNQGNQSAPSEEISVTVTGLSEHPPIGFDNYALLSNYPNPFNPSTIIPYRLKEGGYVKLYIYDMKGELGKTLVNQWQASGCYEVVFHPNADERKKASNLEVPMGRTYSDMSSGVYLYQIIVRGEGDIPVFSDMGKMILMK